MLLAEIVGQDKILALGLMNHVTSFPTSIKNGIITSSEDWIDIFFGRKIKLHPGFWMNVLPKSMYTIIPDYQTADIFEKEFQITCALKKIFPSDYNNISPLMKYESFDIGAIKFLIETLTDRFNSIKSKYKNEPEKMKIFTHWIIEEFLPYKLMAFYLFSRVDETNTEKLSSDYPNILLACILQNIYDLKKGRPVLNNIATCVKLFFNFVDLNPAYYSRIFVNLLDESKIQEFEYLLNDLINRPPDLMDVIKSIRLDMKYQNPYDDVTYKKPPVENYSTSTLSEEDRNETIVFGQNIIKGLISIRDFIDIVNYLDEETVARYIDFRFTFDLSEQSKMYLTDSSNIKMCDVITAKQTKTIIRCDDVMHDVLFIVVEELATSDIYGISLNPIPGSGNLRYLNKIEKDGETVIYKFLSGGE